MDHLRRASCAVIIDGDTQHARLPVRIGQIRADGQVTILPNADSKTPIKPGAVPGIS